MKTKQRGPLTPKKFRGHLSSVTAPVSVPLASPAMKFLCALGDASGPCDQIQAVSERGKAMFRCGYKYFGFKNGSYFGYLAARATTQDAVELYSLQSRPGRKGTGTMIMQQVIALADAMQVKLWLCACPFGRLTPQMPVDRLRDWYKRFGFRVVHKIDRSWINDYHRTDTCIVNAPKMIRSPQCVSLQHNRTVEQEGDPLDLCMRRAKSHK